jgi:hypothetical protein
MLLSSLRLSLRIPTLRPTSSIYYKATFTTSTKPIMSKNILNWASKDGEFRRQTSSFRDNVSPDANATFAAEP